MNYKEKLTSWTKVEDRLPKYNGRYNVVCNVHCELVGGFREVRTYFFERNDSKRTFHWAIPDDDIVTITHWRDLPELPEDE